MEPYTQAWRVTRDDTLFGDSPVPRYAQLAALFRRRIERGVWGPGTQLPTLERLTLSPTLRTGILTGFIGGYTTFSTFEMETLLLAEGGEAFKAILYVILSVGLGFLAAFGGAYVARNL